MSTRVLIVDDEADNLAVYQRFLALLGEVHTAGSAEEALSVLDDVMPDVLVTDIRMPGRSGVELAAEVRRRLPLCEVVIVTGYADVETAIEAVHLGVVEYLRKPVRRQQLIDAVERAAERGRVLRSHQRQQERTPDEGLGLLLGESPAMQRLRAAIVRVQNAEVNVLVLGETGTGKELVARAIHAGSHRADGPFLAINCAAIAPDILESELFGHERGAYTGALTKAEGLLESTNGGTFFLDEVGDCPLDLQSKLLRVLEERKVLPVGGRVPRPIDIRLVAATNKGLPEEVAAGRFREDLYYRLNVFPLRTPSLRERPEDILPLFEHFLRRFLARSGGRGGEVSDDLAELLRARPWSGNVRELQNLAARLAILAPEGPYTPETLADCEALDEAAAPPRASEEAGGGGLDLGEVLSRPSPPPLEEVERAYVLGILERCEGHKTETARVLGIHRVTLNRKLERWGIGGSEDD